MSGWNSPLFQLKRRKCQEHFAITFKRSPLGHIFQSHTPLTHQIPTHLSLISFFSTRRAPRSPSATTRGSSQETWSTTTPVRGRAQAPTSGGLGRQNGTGRVRRGGEGRIMGSWGGKRSWWEGGTLREEEELFTWTQRAGITNKEKRLSRQSNSSEHQ